MSADSLVGRLRRFGEKGGQATLRADDFTDAANAIDTLIAEASQKDLIIRELVSLWMRDAKHLPEDKQARLFDYLRRKNIMPSPFRAALKG